MTIERLAQVENERKMAAQNLGARRARDPGMALLLRASRAQIWRTLFTLVLISRHDELLVIHWLLPSFYELDNKLGQKDKKKMVAIKSGGQKRVKEGHAIHARFRRGHSSLTSFYSRHDELSEIKTTCTLPPPSLPPSYEFRQQTCVYLS